LIPAGLGRNEWAYFPDASDPFAQSVVTFQGTREEANSVIRWWSARRRLAGKASWASGRIRPIAPAARRMAPGARSG